MSERLRQLILLLRSHLLGFDAKALFPALSEAEWNELYELALSHGVQGFAYEGAYRLGLKLPDGLRKIWRAKMVNDVRRYFEIRNECVYLVEKLESNGIKPVILKGFSVSRFYPFPELRLMGDMDILVDEDFYQAALMLEEAGYRARKEVAVHHIEFTNDKFLLELHRMPLTPAGYKDYDRLVAMVNFTELMNRCRFFDLNAISMLGLGEDDFIHLNFVHILKHLFHDRVVLRNFCDIVVLFNSIRREDWQGYYDMFVDCGLEKHFSGLVSFLVFEFGLPHELVNGIKLLDKAEADDFAAAVFSVTSVKEGANQYYSSLSFKGVLKMLFLYLEAAGRDTLIKYPYCRKFILLRPVGFIHAYVDYAGELLKKLVGRQNEK
ncbi:MAG: nucleotidyltransferase family protein [Lachnospiraceae bacterium]|nr:nucleotidyltransferase family protein [Lachnospiraceae bacterium]